MNKTVIELLENWYNYSKDTFLIDENDSTLMCYGTGYSGWAVQTNQKALACFAILGVKTNNREIIDTALKMLRFSLYTHIEGPIHCYDGKKWGHNWISSLGVERMMNGVELLLPYMEEKDKEVLKKVLVSECNWLMDCYDIKAGLYNKDAMNRPESNMWNGAILYRTAKMYPDLNRSQYYIDKAEKYFANSISLPKDMDKEEVNGSNFFASYALNHHGYLNVGYMVITISQIAILHFFLKKHKIEPPKNLYNNIEGLWKLVKSCIAPDGRLIRIGGDTRVRYCYCQDYLIPTLMFIRDYLNDIDCDEYLKGWINIVQNECKNNNDGSFLSDRCGKMGAVSPIYYSRLESDRANTISFLLLDSGHDYMLKKIDVHKFWYDEYHGSCFVNNENSMLSWTWRGSDGPLGLCIPKSDTSLAEYHHNMIGEVEGIGLTHDYTLLSHTEKSFDGGFITNGSFTIIGTCFLAEQQNEDNLLTEHICVAVLPDSCTMVVIQSGILNKNSLSVINELYELNLKIPNDVFNNFTRRYAYANGTQDVKGVNKENIISVGKWLNIDEKMGIVLLYSPYSELKIKTSSQRNAKIKTKWRSETYNTGNLGYDRIIAGSIDKQQYFIGDKKVIDCAFAVIANATHDTTCIVAEHKKTIEVIVKDDTNVRYAEVVGQNGRTYLLISNFEDTDQTVKLSSKAMINLLNRETVFGTLHLSAHNSVLLQKIDGGEINV